MPLSEGPGEVGTPANGGIGGGIPRSVGARCKSLMGSSRVGTHRAGSSGEVEVVTGQGELRPPGQGMLKAVGAETVAISLGQNTYLWAICMVAALGGLLFGYDWVVIGGAKPFYEKFFELSNGSEQGWAMSCALLGCLLGAVFSGSASDRYGRKILLILAALLFGVSSVGTALEQVFHHFVMWRIVGGMAIGLASNLSPMYIAEISPAAVRGKLVSLNQLTIVMEIGRASCRERV